MTEYLTEQEQIEILKSWLKQYSGVIIGGILIALLIISGWRYWEARQAKTLRHASSIYDEMLAARLQNESDTIWIKAKKLNKDYKRTVYGQMAAFMLSKNAIDHNQYQEAKQYLNEAIKNSSTASFREIARTRLARVLIAENHAAESLEILKTVDDKNFLGLINEIRGDAYLSMNKPETAKKYYQLALNELPHADTTRPLLQMKYDQLA